MAKFNCMDRNADQLADSDLIVRKDETAARTQVHDATSELRARAFPANLQIYFDARFFSPLIHNVIQRRFSERAMVHLNRQKMQIMWMRQIINKRLVKS